MAEPDRATSESPTFRELLAVALDAYETSGQLGFDAFCDAHPTVAPRLRERLSMLCDLGLMPAASGREHDTPDRIGGFRILRRLGGGGMGVVYLAYDERLDRSVALKTITPFVTASSSARERFAREVRAVAQMQHPGVVPIYEWGESPAGSFFTMEYVRGRTLAEIVATLRDREDAKLDGDALFAALTKECGDATGAETAGARAAFSGRGYTECAARIARDAALALHHAHERGIVHRDVKPSNVIVGFDGRVRVLDFGLAQIASESGITLTGDVLGTAPYMSPEQVESSDTPLDARTDVYSLGATLYELLSLRPPFEGRTQQQVLHQIPLHDPTPLRQLSSLVVRDLETICATALDKDRSRRYASARALAEDLECFLAQRPIRARPLGALTRASRFARRSPGASAALVLGTLLLVGAPIGLAIANARIRTERDRAREQEEFALQSVASLEEVLDYLTDFISMSDIEEHGPDLTMRDALKLASDKLLSDASVELEPRARARVMTTIGSIYWIQNELDRAEALLTRALETQLTTLGEEHRETALTRTFIGNLRRSQARHEDAELEYRQARATFSKLLGAASDDGIMAHSNLVQVVAHLGKDLAEAESLSHELIAAIRSRAEPDAAALCRAYTTLGAVQMYRGRRDEAQVSFEVALETSRAVAEPAGIQAGIYERLGELASTRHEYESASAHYRRSSELYGQVFGPRHPFAAIPLVTAGEALRFANKFDEAERTLREALAILREAVGDQHPDTAWAEWMLGRTLLHRGRLVEAEQHLRGAWPILVPEDGTGRPHHEAYVGSDLGFCLARSGRHAEAVEVLEKALERILAFGDVAATEAAECRRWLEASRQAAGGGDYVSPEASNATPR